MSKRLTGKVAIVTGSGGGIGRCCALLMAKEGASVVVNDTGKRTNANAEAVVAEIRDAGGQAVANVDSATSDGAEAIVRSAVDAFGRVDILVNNATAGSGPADLWDVDDQAFDSQFEVNLKGYFAMTRAIVPHFCGQGSGVILNMSSASGFGHPSMVAYASAKEGVLGLTRTVAREIGRFGVRCNAIRPLGLGVSSSEYATATQKWNKLMYLTVGSPEIPLDQEAISFETHPAWKIAPMMVWLCTDAASEVNGRTFHVRGDEVALMHEPAHQYEILQAGGWTLDALDEIAPAQLLKGVKNAYLFEDQPDLQHYDGPSA